MHDGVHPYGAFSSGASSSARAHRFDHETRIAGCSPAIHTLRQEIERFAPSSAPVVIVGETGTGKELVAEALHRLSPRAKQPFVAVSLAEFSASLIESALFGHVRGSFTGAYGPHRGLFEQADRGTLFLDEFVDVPLTVQTRLLRVLETQEVRPVGSERARPVKVRLVVATHTDPALLVREGRLTDSTTHYTAVHVEPFDLQGDRLHPGFHLRNSEVGASALSLDDHWLRLVCTNGLMVRVGGKRSLYRTHRAIEDDQLAAALVIAIGRLPERWQTSFAWMQAAKRVTVPHPDDAIEAILGDSAEVPKALLEEAQRLVLRDGDSTRYGVVQAITLVAHQTNKDPDVRFAMECLAGDYLAATPIISMA